MSLFLIIKLVFISDIDIYQFVEKVARGGLSYISQGYRKSNNKYMKSFDKVKHRNISYMKIQIICMDREGLNIFLLA